MNQQSDEFAGRAKEATGIITRNEALEAKGREDRATAQLNGAIDNATSHVDAGLGHAQEKVDGVFRRLSRWVRRS